MTWHDGAPVVEEKPVPRAPKGTGPAGRKLWKAVVEPFDLDEHELSLLRQACHAADLCDDLQAVVDTEGPIVTVRGEPKTHPAVVELRQQRLLLARLVVALRVPIGDQTEGEARTTPGKRLQRRSTRGFYAISGGAS